MVENQAKEIEVQLKQISHYYVNERGVFNALSDINLSIIKGEFISLVGPSGCGKTTLLNMLAGLLKPTSGEILLNGEHIQGPSSKLGYMQQQDFLFPWRTIMGNLMLGLEIQKVKSSNDVDRASELLAELGLAGTEAKYPHQLSGGMRQRVALARTLITNPEILLLDEPFSALDLQIKMQLEQLVRSTLQRLKKTAVLVTHDLGEAVAISDRIIIMGKNPGHIVREVTLPEQLRVLEPFEARKHPLYQNYFDEIWRSLDELEQEKGGIARG